MTTSIVPFQNQKKNSLLAEQLSRSKLAVRIFAGVELVDLVEHAGV